MADPRPAPAGVPVRLRRARSADPIVEPLWPGVRVLAALDRRPTAATTTAIVDEAGPGRGPPGDRDRARRRGQGRRARSSTATSPSRSPTTPTASSTALVTRARRPARCIAQTLVVGMRRNRRGRDDPRSADASAAPRRSAPTTRSHFVAVDLLWLDGESLLDVPLLERKRLLESVLDESDLVRRGRSSGRRSRRGSARGARSASAASPSRPPTAATAPARPPTTGRSPRCRAADRGRPGAASRASGMVRWARAPDRPDAGRSASRSRGSAGPTSWSASRASRTPRPSATWCAPPRPASSSTSRTCTRSSSTRTPARPTAPAASSSRPSRPTTSSRSCSSGRATSSSGSA